jgi:protein TonB
MATITTADSVSDILETATHDRVWLGVALAAAIGGHAAVASALPRHSFLHQPARAPSHIVDIDLAPVVSRPPDIATPSEPPKHETTRLPGPPQARPQNPAPSHAAAVLTRPDHANDPLDFTDSFVVGSASTYAGGATAAQGIGSGAGPVPVPSAQPSPPPAPPPSSPGPDRHRNPSVAGGDEWRCPFPPEADAADVDSAVATLRVAVDASGTVHSVSVQSDPGHGFGREASRCALTRPWSPALDHDGKPIDGVAVVRVRFVR